MTQEEITAIMRHTFFVAIELAAPFLLIVLIMGFLISLIQSLTRLQEMTLSFVPKILALAFSLALLFPWMMKIMIKFTHTILITEWNKVVEALHHGTC